MIEAEALSERYGATVAVDGLTPVRPASGGDPIARCAGRCARWEPSWRPIPSIPGVPPVPTYRP
jgi:hypothetical protein